MKYLSKKIICLVMFLFGFLGFTFGKSCVENYCRTDTESMLVAAEMKFINDQYKGIHKFDFQTGNKCKFHLSSIAYGFAVIESGLGKSKLATQSNNIFSIKKGSGKYQYIWKEHYGMLAKSKYLKYPNKILSVLDFMYTYKYGYSCGTGRLTINVYKTGKTEGDSNSERYHNNLLKSINYFEKKYYGPDEKYKKVVEIKKPVKKKITKKKVTTKKQLIVKKVGDNKFTAQPKLEVKKVGNNKFTAEVKTIKK